MEKGSSVIEINAKEFKRSILNKYWSEIGERWFK